MASTDVFTSFAANILINTMTPKEITAKFFKSLDKAEEFTYSYLKDLEAKEFMLLLQLN